ncbi:MAG: alpha/beta fold hydrolase [Bacteroidia bacterium]
MPTTLHQLSTRKGTVAYTRYGQGIPVLYLHGGHGNAYERIGHQGLNPSQFDLITPSRPGYLGSPLVQNHSPIQAAELMAALMEQLGIKQYHVLAVSAAGPTAIALASLYPDRIQSLVLASAVSKRWLKPSDEMYQHARRIFHPRREKWSWAAMRLFARLWPTGAARALLKSLSTSKNVVLQTADVQAIKQMLLSQGSGDGLMADLEHETHKFQLNQISAPCLVVHSVNDKMVPPAHAEYAAATIPRIQLEWVQNNWGHLIWLGPEAALICQKISFFIQSNQIKP